MFQPCLIAGPPWYSHVVSIHCGTWHRGTLSFHGHHRLRGGPGRSQVPLVGRATAFGGHAMRWRCPGVPPLPSGEVVGLTFTYLKRQFWIIWPGKTCWLYFKTPGEKKCVWIIWWPKLRHLRVFKWPNMAPARPARPGSHLLHAAAGCCQLDLSLGAAGLGATTRPRHINFLRAGNNEHCYLLLSGYPWYLLIFWQSKENLFCLGLSHLDPSKGQRKLNMAQTSFQFS